MVKDTSRFLNVLGCDVKISVSVRTHKLLGR